MVMRNAEKLYGIHDRYQRSGRHVNRLPTASQPDPISLNDPILTRVFYVIANSDISMWNLDPTDVNYWTTELANGRIPSGYANLEEFEKAVIKKCSFLYNLTKKKLR